MNYFPFHVGDYAAHTAHLEPMEDLAYRRLLDLYYLREEPLPADVQATARLVRMRSMVGDVESVLTEFFTLTDDGWRHARCDAEIDSMRVKQLAQEDRERHETDRMRRYRERRASMFADLRALEIVPAWDVSMKELQRLHGEHCNKPATSPATDLQREQAVSGESPATAISTNTNTNTNTIKEEGETPRKRSAPPALARPDDVAEQTWRDWLELRKAKRAPVTETVLKGARFESAKAGMELDAFLQVWCMRGTTGLQADWLRPDERRTASRVQPMSFAQQDAAEKRKRWEQMTGRKWPEEGAPADCIDAQIIEPIDPRRIAA